MIRRTIHILIVFILLALTALAGYYSTAHKQPVEEMPPTLKELYTALTVSTEAAVLHADSLGQYSLSDSLSRQLPDTLYRLLLAHIDDEWADTMLMRTYHAYTPWQKRHLLRAFPPAKQQTEGIRTLAEFFRSDSGDREGWPYENIQTADTLGNIVSLSALVGKTDYVLVYFWATYSYQSTRLLPELARLHKEAEGRLQLLIISQDQDAAVWRTYLSQHAVCGIQTRSVSEFPYITKDVYQVHYLPTLFLINREGIITLYHPTIDELRQTISNAEGTKPRQTINTTIQ